MHGDAASELARQGRAVLASHPEVKHRWEQIPTGVRLAFPAEAADAFEVAVEAYGGAVLVSGVGFHTHFDWQGNAAENVRAALALARDLLSPAMRVREVSAGGRPYKWELQRLDGRDWRTEEVTVVPGTVFWNYFGRRSERIYQNRTLPVRDEPA
jgi:hypothetical protein